MEAGASFTRLPLLVGTPPANESSQMRMYQKFPSRFGFGSWCRRLAIASKSPRSLPAEFASGGTITQPNCCAICGIVLRPLVAIMPMNSCPRLCPKSWERMTGVRPVAQLGLYRPIKNIRFINGEGRSEGRRCQSPERSGAGGRGSEHGAVLGYAPRRAAQARLTGGADWSSRLRCETNVRKKGQPKA